MANVILVKKVLVKKIEQNSPINEEASDTINSNSTSVFNEKDISKEIENGHCDIIDQEIDPIDMISNCTSNTLEIKHAHYLIFDFEITLGNLCTKHFFGGFHLHILVFPFIYQFYTRMTTLVQSQFQNPSELFIFIS